MGDKICKQKGIKNVALKYNLFDPKIETKFSKDEGSFASFIRKIEDNITLVKKNKTPLHDDNKEDTLLIRKIVEFQFRRSIAVHNQLERRLKHEAQRFESLQGKELGKLFLDAIQIPETWNNIKHGIIQQISSSSISDNILLTRNCYICFIESSKPAEFITSDFPVYFFAENTNNFELSFPLTKNILILIT